ncbi:DUF6377 domain-containing protein [Sediminitomix flava]|uniref:DUF6377 domain-containing protein n=1 Tax=Sediminitomix flava TaxID=379075 RepID=A0A315ZBM6_SEDFL|nr:DUF6377 domain-containing protein [Sediminitomix flava]PWJ42473.1 hypothetical protein BC781_10214 [Sediminitomix flava]
MKNRWLIVFFLGCFYTIYPSYGQDVSLEKALEDLDERLDRREDYIQQKKGQLKELKKQANSEKSTSERFKKFRYISEVYLPFNADSALFYAENAFAEAEKLHSTKILVDAKLQLVQTYRLQGMYIESLETLEGIRKEHLAQDQRAFYYMVYSSLYGSMSAHRSNLTRKEEFMQKSNRYQDSLLLHLDKNDNVYRVVNAEKKLRNGEKEEAITILKKAISQLPMEDRAYAFTAYALSSCFNNASEIDKKMYYLSLSAQSDIICAIQENVSLRELALLLFEAGNIEKAYKYIRIALDDALASNTSLRTYEVLEILPVIDHAYEDMRERRRQNLLYFTWVGGMLSLLLLFAFMHIRKQKRKLEDANQEISEKHEQMHLLNEQLLASNEKVAATNQQLKAANNLQEEYIARYLKLCSTYIGKIDNYRLSLSRKAAKSSKEELVKQLKSKDIVDKELQSFYADFDQSFLDLHPNFVVAYNQLLKEDEQIVLKPHERLNTELRIFALIRLGITESSQIAEFLRYSVTTIYNYRTKARNKAKVTRDEFEDHVMRID